MRTPPTTLLLSVAIVAVAVVSRPTSASEPALESGSELDVSSEVEEISVRGSTPEFGRLDASGFSGAELERLRIQDLGDLSRHLPGLDLGQEGGASRITLRGLGTEDVSIGAEPSVQVLIDGVGGGQAETGLTRFFDIEHVEVERGPQGQRGGRRAAAGRIQVVTRKPHAEFESRLAVELGSFNAQAVSAAVNLPLSETLQLRMSLHRTRRDGYARNLFFRDDARDAFDADDFGWRSWLRVQPRDDFELLIGVHRYTQRGVGPAAELLPQVPVDVCSFLGAERRGHQSALPRWAHCIPGFHAVDDSAILKPNRSYLNTPPRLKRRSWGLVSIARLTLARSGVLGPSEISFRSGADFGSLRRRSDDDGTDVAFLASESELDSRQQSHELQWSGGSRDSIEWLASLIYTRDEARAGLVETLSFLSPLPKLARVHQTVANRSLGAAFSVDWYPLQELRLTLGGRYQRDERETLLLRDGAVNDPVTFGATQVDCEGGADFRLIQLAQYPARCRVRARRVTGEFRAELRPDSSSLIYASLANGVRAAGFAALEPGEQQSESVWNLALGGRREFLNRRVSLAAEAFWYRYRDYQLVVWDGSARRAENADRASVRGVDLAAQLRPASGLTVSARASLLDARLDEFFSVDPVDAFANTRCKQRIASGQECQQQDYSGNRMSRAPRWSASLRIAYRAETTRWGAVTPSLHVFWQDETYHRAFNRDFDRQSGYRRTNVALTWDSPSERWVAQLALENLENEATLQNVFVGSASLGRPPPRFAWYGAPRLLGFRLGFNF